MIHEQTIPCPVCQTKVPFEPQALIRGVQFSCPTCFAMIGIAQESIQDAKNAMDEFNALKKTMGKKTK